MKTMIRFVLATLAAVTVGTQSFAQWVKVKVPNDSISNIFVIGKDIFGVVGNPWDGGSLILSTNNGNNWAPVDSGLKGNYVRTLTIVGANLFAGTEGGGVFRSPNYGVSWTPVCSGYVYSLAVDGDNIFAGTDSGVFLSSNNGNNWTALNKGLSNTFVTVLAVSGMNLFAGTGGSGLFISIDKGTSWDACLPGNHVVRALGTFGTNVFVGCGAISSKDYGGFHHSTNNGIDWVYNETLDCIESIAVYPDRRGGCYLFACNAGPGWSGSSNRPVVMNAADTLEYYGIHLSADNGLNWSSAHHGLPVSEVYSIAIKDGDLFAVTSNGLWRRPLSEMIPTSVDHASHQLPDRFKLEQNYPNPFNPTTVIGYHVAVNSLVTLKIFDLLGREVAVLVNERKDAGRYSVQWDASRFSSGVYFYTLQTGQFRETKRMILMK